MKTILLSFLTFTVFGFGTYAQNVTIPNAQFKDFLVRDTAINTNGDKEIQVSEANAFAGTIDCSNKSISDLTGIEAFTALTVLNCKTNDLKKLDVTQNTALTHLYCDRNSLTSLDVTKNTALTLLNCNRNELTVLNVSKNPVLDVLDCSQNKLTAIDVTQNPALAVLYCDKMDLTAIDVTHNPALSTFSCAYNNLTVLDVTQNPALSTINCGTNNLKVLDVSKNPALRSLTCPNNALTVLDLSQNPTFYSLNCSNNFITELNLSKNPVFFSLMCNNNALTSLNVANGVNTQFYQFQVYNNPDLRCIEVDDATWSTSHWSYIDSTAYFSNNCGGTVGIEMQTSINNLSVYPNPVSSQITIDSNEQIENVEIYNSMGELVQTETTSNFNVADLPNGTYILKIKTNFGTVNRRFVKNK